MVGIGGGVVEQLRVAGESFPANLRMESERIGPGVEGINSGAGSGIQMMANKHASDKIPNKIRHHLCPTRRIFKKKR